MSTIGPKVAEALARFGRPLTLRRITEGAPSPNQDVTVYATPFKPAALTRKDQLIDSAESMLNTTTIGDAEIVAASWPGPPARGDYLIDGQRMLMIRNATSRSLSGETLVHDLLVDG